MSAAQTQNGKNVVGRFPDCVERLKGLLSQDSTRQPHRRQYEDLPLKRKHQSAQHSPSLAGLLHQQFKQCLLELQCSKGRVVIDDQCQSPSSLLLMQAHGVYVANLEDKDGDHGYAVALDLRDPAQAAIIDAADEQARLPLNDEILQR